jgi:RNA polymerase sigma-70 factor, ECF subfamily
MKRARSDDAGRAQKRAHWMALAQQGDVDGYRALLDDIGPALLGFLRQRIADPDEAEDAYQDTLMYLHRARHTYDPRRPIEPWLFAIARNVMTDHGRRRRVRARETLLGSLPERGAESDRDMRPELERALAQLPAAQREALEMLKFEGLTVAEAAARAGTTTGALKVRAHRAYRALKALLGG